MHRVAIPEARDPGDFHLILYMANAGDLRYALADASFLLARENASPNLDHTGLDGDLDLSGIHDSAAAQPPEDFLSDELIGSGWAVE